MFEKLNSNEEFFTALSDLGIYITDYETGESLSSNIWKDIVEHFDVHGKLMIFFTYSSG